MAPTDSSAAIVMLAVLGVVAALVLAQLVHYCHDITLGWRDTVGFCIATVAASMAVGLRWSGDPALPAWWWLALCGLALAVIDTVQHRLPHPWVLAMACGGLLAFTVACVGSEHWWPLGRAITAGVVTLAAGMALHVVAAGHLGGGDVTLVAALAVFLGWDGWQTVLLGVLAGVVVLGLYAGWVWLSTGRRSWRIPAGPSLIAGTWISLVVFSPA